VRARSQSSTFLAAAAFLALAGPARADLTIRAVHFRDGSMSPDLRLRQDERIELTAASSPGP